MKILTNTIFPILFLGLIASSFLSIEFGLPWMLLLTVVMGYREVSNNKCWQQYNLSNLMLIYVFWLFFCAQFSKVPSASVMMLAILSSLPITYLVATNLKDFSKYWIFLRVGFLVLGFIFSLWGIWQVYAHIARGHAIGPLVDRNAFAALINLLWFPASYLFLTKEFNNKTWIRSVIGIGLFVMSGTLFATSSRGGIGIWLLLTPLMLWAATRYGQRITLVMLVPLIAFLAYISSTVILESNIANRTFELSQDASTGARLMMWQSSIQMALAHPIIGTGWGTWSYFYPAYRLETENISAGFFAHNDYLQVASEGGVIAFLIFAGILLGLLNLLKCSFKQSSSESNFERISLLLGVLAIFIHAGVNFIFYFAVINTVAGLLLARVVQLTGVARSISVPQFAKISKPIKRLVLGFILAFIATPYLLHQLAVLSFYGSQPALKAINLVAPSLTVQEIANFIVTVRPQNDLAQDALLQTSEFYLANATELGIDLDAQRIIINDAILRFDILRRISANKPNTGLREVSMLMASKNLIGKESVYAKAHKVLEDNLDANPYHAKSYR